MASGGVGDQVGALQKRGWKTFCFLCRTFLNRKPEEKLVAEVLVQFGELINDEHGRLYIARAIGEEMPNDTRWQGWIEFVPEDGRAPIASDRETTQPNRKDAEYWATGLTPVYLEGALQRALHPLRLETHVTTVTRIEHVQEEVRPTDPADWRD